MLTSLMLMLAFAPGDDPSKEPKSFDIQARGYWSGSTRPGTRGVQAAARDLKELSKYTGLSEKLTLTRLQQRLKVKEIDWDKHMVLLVTAGAKPTGGYTLKVEDIKAKGDTVQVRWSLQAPRGFATQAFTHPGEVVLIPKSKKKVEFEMIRPKGGGGRIGR